MNAFELTLILADLKSNFTIKNAQSVSSKINSRYFSGTLFTTNIPDMKILLKILRVCKIKYRSNLSVELEHYLRKSISDSVLDSSTGLKAQRAT